MTQQPPGIRNLGDPVPNQFPTVEPPGRARIAIVGQSPGHDEDWQGVPFVGRSGKLLDSALGKSGLARNQCFVGNVCQVRPNEADDFNALEWDGQLVQEGISNLQRDLEIFRPTMVLLLGNEALHLFKNGNLPVKKVWRQGRQEFDWPDRVGSWRGSLWGSEWFEGVKVMATYHPAAVARDYSLQAYYRVLPGIGDLERLRVEAGDPLVRRPKRKIGVVGRDHTLLEGLLWLSICKAERRPVAFDLEGGCGNVTSLAFSRRPDSALVFPLAHIDGTSVWEEDEEAQIWEAVQGLVEDPLVPKVAQNGARYDFFILAWTYGIVVRGYTNDTKLAWWEVAAELRKSLAVQTSLLTLEPYYKPDKEEDEEGGEKLKFASDEEFWGYNGLDAAVTMEVWEKELGLMLPHQRAHYDWNGRFLPRVLYMELRGMRVSKERVREMRGRAEEQVAGLQGLIDRCQAAADGEAAGKLRELERVVGEGDEEGMAGLALRELGGKRPRERREVVVERWQPMMRGGTIKKPKWVKEGKLVTVIEGQNHIGSEPPDCWGKRWLKPMPKTVSKLLPFTPTTLSSLEPHILKSKAEEWEVVKKTWRKVKSYDKESTSMGGEKAGVGGDTASGGEGGVGRGGAEKEGGGGGEDLAGGGKEDSGVGVPRRSGPLVTLAQALGFSVNTGSNAAGGDTQRFLYTTCGLPRIFEHLKTGRLSKEGEDDWKKRLKGEKVGVPVGKKVTTAQDALDKLYAETQDERALWVLQQRRVRKALSDLDVELDGDGRLRCAISLVKDTGRMAASKSNTGTGANLMAWNKDLRRICVADEEMEFYRFDLTGADSWTVAAELAGLGDRTMLEDLKAGLRPAKVLSLLYLLGGEVNKWDRERIKKELREVKFEVWHYPASKEGAHSTSYGAGWQTVRDSILKRSLSDLPLVLKEAKPIVLTKKQVETLQGAFLSRYAIKRWHEKEGKEMVEKGYILTSPGHVRRFYAKKAEWDSSRGKAVPCHETLKSWLADKPQFYTTWALKRALERLWDDPENRRADGSFRVEPLLCVHDSLDFQAPVEEREFASRKGREWFQNEVELAAGVKVVIPAEGKRGGDWGLEEGVEV